MNIVLVPHKYPMEALRDGALGPEHDAAELGERLGVQGHELDCVHGAGAEQGEEDHAVVFGSVRLEFKVNIRLKYVALDKRGNM